MIFKIDPFHNYIFSYPCGVRNNQMKRGDKMIQVREEEEKIL